MSRQVRGWLAIVWVAPLLFLAAGAGAVARDDDTLGFERTPPRLSFTDGAVSFMRQGAEDWTPARVNTALATGDGLYAAEGSNLEIQIGPRAYVRAGELTDLGLVSLEPDFLQLRVTSGSVSLDLRSLKVGQTLEVDTPHAAFTVERTGYYRIGVAEDVTTFTTRRGGRATVTTPTGESATVAASEQVVVRDGDAPLVETYAAPELDAWDRWNYARTDEQLDAVSARYVPSEVYGADDLDHYGDWRVVPTYGAIWVPHAVAVGWVPYSTGRWMYDAYYGWTWVDDAPWGWAPFHYGRWVNVSGYWGWCPGPLVRRAYYAPALVAFYGGGGFSLSLSIGTPQIGWVALGWGEPLVPWWGPRHFREHPHWAGWGGPRIVNNIEINHTTVIHVHDIHHYRNADVRDAIVEVDRKHFGRHSKDHDEHYRRGRPDSLKPVHDDWSVDPDPSSLVADARPSERPRHHAERPTVTAKREPRHEGRAPGPESERGSGRGRGHGKGEPAHDAIATANSTPSSDDTEPRREERRNQASRRPPFGRDSESVRRIPPPAPRFEDPERPAPQPPGRRVDPGAVHRGNEKAIPSPRGRDDVKTSGRGRDEATTGARDRGEPKGRGRERAAEAPTAAAPPPPDAVARPAPPEAPQERAGRGDRGHRRGDFEPRERPAAPPPDLPGEPANRVYRPPQQPQEAVRGESGAGSRIESQPPAAMGDRPSGRSNEQHTERSGEGRSSRGHRGDRSSGSPGQDDRVQ